MLTVKDKLGFNFNYFDAVQPNEITDEMEQKYFSNTDFYEWDINQKAVMATFMSHMKLLDYACKNKNNLLIIEDDIDYVGNLDFDNINFDSFDIFNVGTTFGCYSYFVSPQGACKILNEIDSKQITQAYDWELNKLIGVKKQISETPHFIQVENKFKSNISPDGYKRY